MSKTPVVLKANQNFATFFSLNRKLLLATLIKHETLTEKDIAKVENRGLIPDKVQRGFPLSKLSLNGHIHARSGVL